MKNSERCIVKIIKEICCESKISYDSFSYDWIFRLSKNGKTKHIFGYQFENSSSTSHLICSDKCATSDVLLSNQIPSVKHVLFMSPRNINYVGVSGNWQKMMELLKEYGRLVCKANEGSGGGSVYLVTNQFELEKATHRIFNYSRTMAVCPFYKIETEFRVIVLNNKVKLVYSKNIPCVEGDGVLNVRQLIISYIQSHNDNTFYFDIPEEDSSRVLNTGEKYYMNWKHNLGQGANPTLVQDGDIIEALSDLALRAAKTVNIQFASVDIIKTEHGYLVLEINSGVMMEYFSQRSNENYQIAKGIYKEAIETMLR